MCCGLFLQSGPPLYHSNNVSKFSLGSGLVLFQDAWKIFHIFLDHKHLHQKSFLLNVNFILEIKISQDLDPANKGDVKAGKPDFCQKVVTLFLTAIPAHYKPLLFFLKPFPAHLSSTAHSTSLPEVEKRINSELFLKNQIK